MSIESDRKAELEKQAAVAKAIHDATHGKDGKPIPIVPPEEEPAKPEKAKS